MPSHRLSAGVVVAAGSMLMVILACGWSSVESRAAQADTSPPALFLDATRQPAAPLPPDSNVLRSRIVEINLAALGDGSVPPPGMAGPSSVGALVTLNPFDDVMKVAVRDSIEPGASGDGFVWIGHIQGEDGSLVTLAVSQGIVIGNIRSGVQVYAVRFLGEGLHVVHEMNPDAFPQRD